MEARPGLDIFSLDYFSCFSLYCQNYSTVLFFEHLYLLRCCWTTVLGTRVLSLYFTQVFQNGVQNDFSRFNKVLRWVSKPMTERSKESKSETRCNLMQDTSFTEVTSLKELGDLTPEIAFSKLVHLKNIYLRLIMQGNPAGGGKRGWSGWFPYF